MSVYPFEAHSCHVGIGCSYKASCARPG